MHPSEWESHLLRKKCIKSIPRGTDDKFNNGSFVLAGSVKHQAAAIQETVLFDCFLFF